MPEHHPQHPAVYVLVAVCAAFLIAIPVYFAAPYIDLLGMGVDINPVALPAAPMPIASQCGNGLLEESEQCDDGNIVIQDGCTGCMVETGYACQGAPSMCIAVSDGSCGDGRVNAGETCDDGNLTVDDGCSRFCSVEPRFRCEGSAPSRCLWATARCGDAVVDIGEPCDDGNTRSGDGCSAACVVEEPYRCGSQPSVCTLPLDPATFGTPPPAAESAPSSSAAPAPAESASSSVAAAVPAAAPAAKASASEAYRFRPRMRAELRSQQETESAELPPLPPRSGCGDGILLDEACDDGDTQSGDGCSDSCAVESGYTCYGTPSRCQILCGDSVIASSESCDDGNSQGGDGCSASCRLEAGWSCTGVPSACILLSAP